MPLRAHFRPEFISRIDELTIFEPLKKTELRQIVSIQIQHIERMLADREIKIHLSSAAQDYLADVGYDPIYGARPLETRRSNGKSKTRSRLKFWKLLLAKVIRFTSIVSMSHPRVAPRSHVNLWHKTT